MTTVYIFFIICSIHFSSVSSGKPLNKWHIKNHVFSYITDQRQSSKQSNILIVFKDPVIMYNNWMFLIHHKTSSFYTSSFSWQCLKDLVFCILYGCYKPIFFKYVTKLNYSYHMVEFKFQHFTVLVKANKNYACVIHT